MSNIVVFGSNEWFEELTQIVQFPSLFSVYYGKHTESHKGVINAVAIDTKAKKENVTYRKLGISLGMAFAPCNWALIDVIECVDAKSYYQQIKEIAATWDVKLNND